MLYLIAVLCAVVCTFFVARYFAVKTRLVEKAIEDTITRKFSASGPGAALNRLKEENVVMRNLLIDMIENETSVPTATSSPPSEEQARAINARIRRRREIFGEAIFVLQQAETSSTRDHNLKIHG
ncbi:hypothetical protein [Rhizobium tubonense]|uniref:Uncharacterized protein n=1 Tax=Rhizobium tubonense TaxID=484088 RepID=A0A2W4D072_9HYPH|nr:hypothetical protein [Rhizobium tubonense]PZM10884.1 hypothetical protein CPY51_21695 [Rhizobium tubonense]